MNKIIFSLTAIALLGGCAMKTKILDTQAVSMTHYSLKDGEKLQEVGPVTGKFCSSTNDKGNIGLIDESVKATQEQYKVDYILNATFWNENGCVSVDGTGAKIVASSGVLAPATSTAPAPALKKQKKTKTQ
jgi:hypothetical protein